MEMYSDQETDAFTGATPYFTDSPSVATRTPTFPKSIYASLSLFVQHTYICLAYCFYNASNFYFVLRLRFDSLVSYCCYKYQFLSQRYNIQHVQNG